MAQENPAPTPEVKPTPLTDATPAAEPSATPAASPAEKKTADEDVIPLPPESGAAEPPMVSETEVAPRPKPGAPLPDSAFADPNAVIPDDASPASPAPVGPSATEIARKLKIRYQEVRTEVEKDPAVRSLREQAQSAKSFEDERAALREYYRLLFKKIKKADKDLATKCDVLENAYIARLAQTRIEPTIPLNPPPAPEPLKE
ncbi:MAG: hypothetical protein WCQ16_11080 [Verrucomicrobiae bacterium]